MSIKSIFVSITVAIILSITIFIGVISAQPNKIEVVNNSDQIIDKVQVVVGGEVYWFQHINVQSTSSVWYFYQGSDSDFKVTVWLSDGTTKSHSDGYTTHGLYFETATIEISDGFKVQIKQ